MHPKNVFERLADTHPELELWWDSSPLIYAAFRARLVREAPEEKREILDAQLGRMYDAEHPERSLFRGVTTNPPLSLQAIEADPARWNAYVDGIVARERGIEAEALFWRVYREMVRVGAEMYLPVFEASGGRYGYISGQVDPRSCFDGDAMLRQALDLASLSPNVMIKIPGTREGYGVIEELTARGIGTNNTLSFVLPQLVACAEAVKRGLARAREAGVSLERWRSVITHMTSRFTLLGDLEKEAAARGIPLEETDIRWAELAVFKRAYRFLQDGDYPSKMLICSMKTGPDTDAGKRFWHLQKLTGANVVFTCPPGFIEKAIKGYDDIPLEADGVAEPVPEEVLARLLEIPYFRSGYEPDGLAPDRFNEHPALLRTARQHQDVTEKMVAFVRGRL